MSSSRKVKAFSMRRSLFVALSLVSTAEVCLAVDYPGVGRAATIDEVKAWDIDVRPDFKGLPKGQGSVAQGQDVWEARCSSCHGIFGDSGETFSPLIGGTTKEDIAKGQVARLNDSGFPGRTTVMKVATVSTLWDYIHRAMPWNQPKSLKPDEVYAVTAFLLNLAGVVSDDFVLSDQTIAQAQARMPNRDGMTLDHGLWPGKAMKSSGKPDVLAKACMKDCETEPKLASFLPEHARNAHGNLAEQNRLVGQQRGADTTRPAPTRLGEFAAAGGVLAAPATPSASRSPADLLKLHGCTTCHAVDSKVVGPAFKEIAAKYAGRTDAAAYLAGKIKAGGSGVWGSVPMPAQGLPDTDAASLGKWLGEGAK